jgi:hypothetical protein
MKFDHAQKHLRSLGIALSACGGDYRLNFIRGHLNTEVITDDLQEAVRLGETMAKNPPPKPLAPIGPMGRPNSQFGRIRRHNRKLAAARAKPAKS